MATERRLIDCEQAKRATYEEVFWTESEQAVVRNFLAKLPKVDAVEVVRCKDCKQWIRNSGIAESPNGHCFCHDIVTNGHDFCSYGERRTDNEDNS